MGIAAALVVVAAVYWLWPDGLVTLDFRDAPLSKVIPSIERQAHVKIATNVPPETPVTIHVRKSTLADVLETLSVRIECDWRAVFVAAPKKAAAEAAFAEMKAGKIPESLAVAWFSGMGMLAGDAAIDPRSLQVQFESGDKNDLKSALQQVSQKSGVMTAIPSDWVPATSAPKSPSAASSSIRQLVKSSGGALAEGFLLWARERPRDDGGEGGGRRRVPDFAGGPREGRDEVNPEWIAQRAEAMIAKLPADERAAAKADFDEMRKIREEIRALPEDQRRAKMQEFFNRPEVQDRMTARQEARDNRMTPAQREKRMQQYLQRKQQMKAAGATPK